jgi:hypothetical protein
MAKTNYYQGKKSEYRNNYLPFDYYDFWMTAKENENLRFRNKIRDYIHTPFDWNEDEEVYLETADKFDQLNQATQTTQRPIMIENHKTSQRHSSGKTQQTQKQNAFFDASAETTINRNQLNNTQFSRNKPRKNRRGRSKSAKVSSNYNNNNYYNSNNNNDKRAAQNFNGPILNQNSKYNLVNQKFNSNIEKIKSNKNQFGNAARNSSNIENRQYKSNGILNRSTTNIAVQTPFGWSLRDFNQNRIPRRSLSRSASVINLQEKKPPFAHYGWASRNKDLACKPTQNALANKV